MQSWSDFFQDSPSNSKNGLTSRFSVTSGTVYVFNSFFVHVEYLSGSGGAISFSSSSDSSILLVEETTFLSCRSSSNGGGVYFYNKGNAVLNKVCSFNCSPTGSNGGFYYNCVTDTKNYKNEIHLSTVSTTTTTYEGAIFIYYGTIQISKTNESFNYGTYCAAYRIQPSGSAGELTGTVSFSTFYNNTATSCRCLNFGTGTNRIQYKMFSCNVIKNTQPTSQTEGIIICWEATTIEGTCILQNSGGSILCNSYSDRIVTISNCTTDFGSQTSGPITIKNVPATTFIHSLSHLSTAKCEAFYEGTKIKTQQIICFTAGKVHQNAIQLFFSLQNNLFRILCLLPVE
jgi:hypothetical protein